MLLASSLLEMGLSSSSYLFNDQESRQITDQLYASRVHTNILIVGNESSGKTTLSNRLRELTKPGKAFIHIFDTDTKDLADITAKLEDAHNNGVNTSGLSILSTKMPIHGIIWVLNAVGMDVPEGYECAREACIRLRNFSRCVSCVFFSHTDLASRSGINRIRALFSVDSSIPSSGEFAPERVFYAPLNDKVDRNADFTILRTVKPISDWAMCSVIPRL